MYHENTYFSLQLNKQIIARSQPESSVSAVQVSFGRCVCVSCSRQRSSKAKICVKCDNIKYCQHLEKQPAKTLHVYGERYSSFVGLFKKHNFKSPSNFRKLSQSPRRPSCHRFSRNIFTKCTCAGRSSQLPNRRALNVTHSLNKLYPIEKSVSELFYFSSKSKSVLHIDLYAVLSVQ